MRQAVEMLGHCESHVVSTWVSVSAHDKITAVERSVGFKAKENGVNIHHPPQCPKSSGQDPSAV